MATTQRRGRLTDNYVDGLTKPGFHRDGLLPGFGVRVGRRKRSFELRIERKGRQKIFRTLGTWPVTKTDEARAAAHDILAQFERKEPIKELRQREMTIAIVWPLYRARLIDEGASPGTLDGYKFAYAWLSEYIRNTPLRELATNSVLMADEVACIRKRLHNSRRGGQAAAAQSARLVSAPFSFAQKRDPTLSGTQSGRRRGCSPDQWVTLRCNFRRLRLAATCGAALEKINRLRAIRWRLAIDILGTMLLGSAAWPWDQQSAAIPFQA